MLNELISIAGLEVICSIRFLRVPLSEKKKLSHYQPLTILR